MTDELKARAWDLIRAGKPDKNELVKLPPEILADLIIGLKAKSVATLGDGECFIRKDKKNNYVSIKGMVALSAAKKEIYQIQKKWTISAEGYTKCNQLAGLSMPHIPWLIFDGQRQCNPYVKYADEFKTRIAYVAVRKVVTGWSPTGNKVAIDRTLIYNMAIYHLQALMSAVSKSEGKAGGISLKEEAPGNLKDKKLRYYEIDNGIGLWVDVGASSIKDVFSDSIQRMKFGERIASTIAERLCMAAHPAIAARTVIPNAQSIAYVPIYSYRPLEGEIEEDLDKTAEKLAEGEAVDGYEVHAETVQAETEEVEAEREIAEAEDEQGRGEKEKEEHRTAVTAESEERPLKKPPMPEEDPRRKDLIAKLKSYEKRDAKLYLTTLARAGATDITKLDEDALFDLLNGPVKDAFTPKDKK